MAAVTLGVLLAASGASESGKPRVYRIAGEVLDEKKKPVPADVLTFDSMGVHVGIRYLDDPMRQTALAGVLGGSANLFPEVSSTSGGFLVFAVEIQNNGKLDLIYEPGQGRLITEKMDTVIPLDYARLYASIPPGARDGLSIELIERAIYARAATIVPGGSVRKLLVFERPFDDRFRKIELRLGPLHTIDGDIEGTFRFRKFEVKT
jgi:hypothetical protein